MSIFVSKNGIEEPLGSAWNISQFEWGAWANAMMSVYPIVRKSISDIAFDQVLIHVGKEREF